MTNSRAFLSQTAETASFAFREYFRPLVGAARFLLSKLTPAKQAESISEDARAILRERLNPNKDKNPI